MALRVSEQSRLSNNISYLQIASTQMAKIQQQMGTGRRVNMPSDDAEGAALSLSYRNEILFETQMRRNIDNGSAFMNAGEAALSNATDLIQNARTLAVAGGNGTNSQSGLDGMATQVDQVLREMIQVANSNFGDAYLFAGQKNDQPAYTTVTDVSGNITAVNYQGDTGTLTRQISRQQIVDVNVVGSTAFGDVFQTLINLRDGLRAGDNTTASQQAGFLDTALNRVLAARADLGTRTNRFQQTEQQSLSKDTDLQKLRSGIEDIDISSAVVKLTSQQNQLQAALAAVGKTINMSLLNFLQ